MVRDDPFLVRCDAVLDTDDAHRYDHGSLTDRVDTLGWGAIRQNGEGRGCRWEKKDGRGGGVRWEKKMREALLLHFALVEVSHTGAERKKFLPGIRSTHLLYLHGSRERIVDKMSCL